MYSTGSNDRAAKVTFEYATPGASWDELAYEEQNRWRNIAFAARVAAGDVRVPDMSASEPVHSHDGYPAYPGLPASR